MSSNNLLKWGYVNVNPDEVRVIDSNELLSRKFGAMSDEADLESMYGMQEAGAEEDEAIAALFGEDEEGQPMEMAGEYEEGAEPPEGFEEGIEAEPYVMSREQAQQIIEQANQEAERILQQAQEHAKVASDQAYEQARLNGRQEGYEEGITKANHELAQQREELGRLKQKLKQKYDEQMAEMEPMLVTALAGVYEHLIGVELSQSKNILMHMIDQTLHSVESSQAYLIHVSEQDYSYVSMKKGELLAEGGQESATLEVIEDKTLAKNECLIETDSGIFDCSLSVQLEELKRKLILLSYGGKG